MMRQSAALDRYVLHTSQEPQITMARYKAIVSAMLNLREIKDFTRSSVRAVVNISHPSSLLLSTDVLRGFHDSCCASDPQAGAVSSLRSYPLQKRPVVSTSDFSCVKFYLEPHNLCSTA